MPMFEDPQTACASEPGKEMASERPSTPSKPIAIPVPTPSPFQPRHLSEESIRTEFCEGPVLASPEPAPAPFFNTSPSGADFTVQRPSTPPKHLADSSPGQSGLIDREKRDSSPWATSVHHDGDDQEIQHTEDGLSIARPRSALHSGDFTVPSPAKQPTNPFEPPAPAEACPTPGSLQSLQAWTTTSPPRHFLPFSFEQRAFRSSVPSVPSPNFVFMPPTSPLVQEQSNVDDAPETPRRHTLGHAGPSLSKGPGPVRRNSHIPCRAHQPRRSLSLAQPHLQMQRPAQLAARSLEALPRQHASLVGSYEESILRGRMSTVPSKPLDFVATIGVLGLGDTCKPSLRCPAHVTLPFAAVFYSYATTAHGHTDDEPSPYVGMVDLENGLPDLEGKAHVRHPRAPPGGSYRIPQQGQLQIIIKNPNKTAVKLFLVPYDLTGMEPGTKTFIRQRSYSEGPILDGVPVRDTSAGRPVLRYLVHVHICSPSRGRFYLYKSIRVVFASRVPDGKKVLRNEVTWPEPRFAAYKPVRMMRDVSVGTKCNDNDDDDLFQKLNRGDVGYGGNAFASTAVDSLLSQRLQSLGADPEDH